MLFGEFANQAVEDDLRGISTHRRTVNLHKYLMDVHCRIREVLLGTSSFGGPDYLCSLGQELGALDARTFDEFLRCMLMWMRKEFPNRPIEHGPVLFIFPTDRELFDALVPTELSRTLRMMLSKSILWYFFNILDRYLIYT